MKDLLNGSWRMLATAWRMDRRKTLIAVLLMVAGTAAGPVMAAVLGAMTDAVVAGHAAEAARSGVVVAALVIVMLTFGHFAHIFYFELSELAELDFDEQLIQISNGSPGIAHHERPELADTLSILQQEGRHYRMGLEALLQGIGLGLAVILTAMLLSLQHPLLLLLPLAAVPPLFTGRWAERVLDRSKTATAEASRVGMHFFHLATTARLAGEVRVFGLDQELRRRQARAWTAATRQLWRAHLIATWVRASGQVLFALAYVAAVLLIVREAVRGDRSVGDVVLVITLAAQVNQQVTMAVTLLQEIHRMSSAYRRLAELRAAVEEQDPGPADAEAPAIIRHGLSLDGVRFAYPGAAEPTLRDVRLRLPAGSTVAIVGENGAGKTTLVKLLCGFYQPTGGTIKLDGLDLRRIPVAAWRSRIAAGFQDFVHLEDLARHSVGVGELSSGSTDLAVNGALGRAHATDLVDRLIDGLDTQLGKSYADGAELSGGQWQKVALGRAMMRESPLLLVLDEPTSALDPEAEHALFERYAEQAKRVGDATGAITLFVSHRFSTVRMAEVIVVVQDGRIVETGDHNALMANRGLYADLYSMQAQAYA